MLLEDCSDEKIGRLPDMVKCSFADIEERRDAVGFDNRPGMEGGRGY